MPIKDQSTLATMEFNSNSKVTKIEKIDSLLMMHPKKGFLEGLNGKMKVSSLYE